MAKAWKPPATTQDYRFWISEHAVKRFRERALEPEMRSRTDRDLALLLDERIYGAISAKRCTVIVDADCPDVDTHVAVIESRTGMLHHVVLRVYKSNSYPLMRTIGGPGGSALAAITVLTESMAAENYAKGRWKVPNRPMAGKLSLVKAADPPPPEVADDDDEEDPTPGKPKAKFATLVTRLGFARKILLSRRHITMFGKDGLNALVEAEFGRGLSWESMTQLKRQVDEEFPLEASAPPAAEIPAAPASKTTPIFQTSSIALQLEQAIEAEKVAKARKHAAEAELLAAGEVLTNASKQVDVLMGQMQAQRGG
jgi:hypothetical protein